MCKSECEAEDAAIAAMERTEDGSRSAVGGGMDDDEAEEATERGDSLGLLV